MNENNDIIWREEAGKGSDAMLTEERHEKIMRLVNTSGAVSVQDLVGFLNHLGIDSPPGFTDP